MDGYQLKLVSVSQEQLLKNMNKHAYAHSFASAKSVRSG